MFYFSACKWSMWRDLQRQPSRTPVHRESVSTDNLAFPNCANHRSLSRPPSRRQPFRIRSLKTRVGPRSGIASVHLRNATDRLLLSPLATGRRRTCHMLKPPNRRGQPKIGGRRTTAIGHPIAPCANRRRESGEDIPHLRARRRLLGTRRASCVICEHCNSSERVRAARVPDFPKSSAFSCFL